MMMHTPETTSQKKKSKKPKKNFNKIEIKPENLFPASIMKMYNLENLAQKEFCKIIYLVYTCMNVTLCTIFKSSTGL